MGYGAIDIGVEMNDALPETLVETFHWNVSTFIHTPFPLPNSQFLPADLYYVLKYQLRQRPNRDWGITKVDANP